MIGMTIGADGVYNYTALENAFILDTNINATYKIFPSWKLSGQIGYNLGNDYNGNNLPLISPFTYGTSIYFKKNLFDAEINLRGAGKQVNYSNYFGENETEAYAIINLNASYKFYLNKQNIFVKAGIENIFDTYYSTYADWNNIPRMGRNVFINISYLIK